MAEVQIQDGETLENALRRFKRKVLQEDIIREVKRHAFYLKPGQKKRVKSALVSCPSDRITNSPSRIGEGPSEWSSDLGVRAYIFANLTSEVCH